MWRSASPVGRQTLQNESDGHRGLTGRGDRPALSELDDRHGLNELDDRWILRCGACSGLRRCAA
jgi:hypothetical protein